MFEGVSPHWMSYVFVESAEASTERAKSLGAEILFGPMEVPGVGKMTFIKDPTGAAISLFEPGEHVGASAKSNLGWSELHTTDTDAAEAFYTELLGWGAKHDDEHGYTEWQVDGTSVGGMMSIPPARREMIPPHWLPYALIDDCDATLAKATERGANVLVPATTMEGVGRFAVFCDPTGAALAIVKLDEHGV